MRGYVLGGALGLLVLLGCRTAGEATCPGAAEAVPERGFTVTGPLVADTKDIMVVRDPLGVDRRIRVTRETQFHDEGGELVVREHLAPGSEVRARYEVEGKEMVATDVLIIRGEEAPGPFPDTNTPYPEIGSEPGPEGVR